MRRKLITQEEVCKVVQLSAVKNTSHVGFPYSGKKGYIVYDGGQYRAIANDDNSRYSTCNTVFGESTKGTIVEVVQYVDDNWGIDEWYVFDTRKELYQWLAE